MTSPISQGSAGLPEDAAGTFQPLAGVNVVEWCSSIAGAFCGKLLAATGGDVIKVEPPRLGDDARRRGPFPQDVPHPERSGLFLYLNLNKRGITLDAGHTAGRALLRRLLLEWADALVTDKTPAELEALGLDAASLAALKPRLVLTTVTLFGHSGPYRDFKGYPLQTAHAGGTSYLQPSGHLYEGHPELPPVKWGGLAAEYDAGLHAANGALAALYVQQLGGAGQHVDVSKQEAEIHAIRAQVDAGGDGNVHRRVSAAAGTGRPTRGNMALSGTMRCKDGFVTLWPLEEYMPEALAAWLGHPAWSREERFTDPAQRAEHALEFRALIEEQLLQYTMQEIYHGLQAVRVAVSPVYDASDILQCPQLEARGFFQSVVHMEAGALPYPALPFKTARAAPFPRPAPLLGEHNDEVYAGMLGYSRDELAALRREAVI